jgi:hypothetical protein
MADGGGTISFGPGRLGPKQDPSRRCLKPPDWPAADGAAWEAAMTSGGLLDEAGLAAHWRGATRKSVQDAYGRWLTFLKRSGELDPDATPGERLTADRLRAFVAELQATVAPMTVRNRIRDLAEALRVMAPEADLSYLRRARARLKARARPVRYKRCRSDPPWPRRLARSSWSGPNRGGAARRSGTRTLPQRPHDPDARLPPHSARASRASGSKAHGGAR